MVTSEIREQFHARLVQILIISRQIIRHLWFYACNILGDELHLNFGAKFQR